MHRCVILSSSTYTYIPTNHSIPSIRRDIRSYVVARVGTYVKDAREEMVENPMKLVARVLHRQAAR
jgi:hypothetical protein